MSVLIKGMEMPTEESIGIFLYPDGRVHVWRPNAMVGQEHKAVPVPAHRRLGDLDALYEKFVRLENEAMQALKTTNAGSVNWIKWSAILTERTGYKFDIADAPTIIPADPAEEG